MGLMPHFIELPMDGIRFFGQRPHVFEAKAIQNQQGKTLLVTGHTAYPIPHKILLQTGRYLETSGPVRMTNLPDLIPPIFECKHDPAFYIEVFASDRLAVIHPAGRNGYQIFQARGQAGYLDLIEWFGDSSLTRLWYSPAQYLEVPGPARILSLPDYQAALSFALKK